MTKLEENLGTPTLPESANNAENAEVIIATQVDTPEKQDDWKQALSEINETTRKGLNLIKAVGRLAISPHTAYKKHTNKTIQTAHETLNGEHTPNNPFELSDEKKEKLRTVPITQTVKAINTLLKDNGVKIKLDLCKNPQGVDSVYLHEIAKMLYDMTIHKQHENFPHKLMIGSNKDTSQSRMFLGLSKAQLIPIETFPNRNTLLEIQEKIETADTITNEILFRRNAIRAIGDKTKNLTQSLAEKIPSSVREKITPQTYPIGSDTQRNTSIHLYQKAQEEYKDLPPEEIFKKIVDTLSRENIPTEDENQQPPYSLQELPRQVKQIENTLLSDASSIKPLLETQDKANIYEKLKDIIKSALILGRDTAPNTTENNSSNAIEENKTLNQISSSIIKIYSALFPSSKSNNNAEKINISTGSSNSGVVNIPTKTPSNPNKIATRNNKPEIINIPTNTPSDLDEISISNNNSEVVNIPGANNQNQVNNQDREENQNQVNNQNQERTIPLPTGGRRRNNTQNNRSHNQPVETLNEEPNTTTNQNQVNSQDQEENQDPVHNQNQVNNQGREENQNQVNNQDREDNQDQVNNQDREDNQDPVRQQVKILMEQEAQQGKNLRNDIDEYLEIFKNNELTISQLGEAHLHIDKKIRYAITSLETLQQKISTLYEKHEFPVSEFENIIEDFSKYKNQLNEKKNFLSDKTFNRIQEINQKKWNMNNPSEKIPNVIPGVYTTKNITPKTPILPSPPQIENDNLSQPDEEVDILPSSPSPEKVQEEKDFSDYLKEYLNKLKEEKLTRNQLEEAYSSIKAKIQNEIINLEILEQKIYTLHGTPELPISEDEERNTLRSISEQKITFEELKNDLEIQADMLRQEINENQLDMNGPSEKIPEAESPKIDTTPANNPSQPQDPNT